MNFSLMGRGTEM
uniref:Uncharacterized protein n=1 Tax=Anguilla anguilla TaxID=7936 RepID=A0A0E9TW81_ANGAN